MVWEYVRGYNHTSSHTQISSILLMSERNVCLVARTSLDLESSIFKHLHRQEVAGIFHKDEISLGEQQMTDEVKTLRCSSSGEQVISKTHRQ